ncbi:MAG: methionine ABC transporter ATP-binding protein [Bifidobacteriaceae bacterium]|jgi:D-methionine transport system ATP-binding protein|nr:methionine ABC transporter ATP-binding protein [Bifidobacteriaceae bacterium]
MDASTAPIIDFRDVSKTFRDKRSTVRAVDHVTLSINPGEVFGVIGYSGAGKSTLVRLVNALERIDPDSGGLTVDGRDVGSLKEGELRNLRRGIGMIFQQFNLLTARTVRDNVAYPLKLADWSKADRLARTAELLDFVGIPDKALAYPAQLSGGQKQRVGIARALAAKPSILLADEATSALDPETTRDVLDLLVRANDEFGVTIVIITHEMSVVQYVCDRTAVMENGRVVEQGRTYDVFANPRHPATQRFVQTALHDRPDPATLARLHVRYPGRLALVTITDTEAGGFALTAATDGTGVKAAIVYGSITEVEKRPFGSVAIELTGPDAEIDVVLGRLAAQGSRIADLGTAANPRPDPLWGVLMGRAAPGGGAGGRATGHDAAGQAAGDDAAGSPTSVPPPDRTPAPGPERGVK